MCPHGCRCHGCLWGDPVRAGSRRGAAGSAGSSSCCRTLRPAQSLAWGRQHTAGWAASSARGTNCYRTELWPGFVSAAPGCGAALGRSGLRGAELCAGGKAAAGGRGAWGFRGVGAGDRSSPRGPGQPQAQNCAVELLAVSGIDPGRPLVDSLIEN